jgi:DNA-directed RNA polymerase subunit RPC12/RpoP
MMFDAICTSCGAVNKTPSHYEGMSIKCVKCSGNFVAIHSKDRLFKFHCSSCSGRIEAKEKLRGKTAPCPHCNKVVPVGDYSPQTKPLKQGPVEDDAGGSASPARGGSITSKIKRAITQLFGG